MFDELDFNALGISVVMVLIIAIFLFRDPAGVGMDELPLMAKLITMLVGLPLMYLVAAYIINK